MTPLAGTWRLATAVLVVVTLVPGAALAQEFGLGNVGAQVGVTKPDDAKAGLGLTAAADIGSVGVSATRLLVGFNYFQASVDRRVAGAPVDGNLRAVGGKIGVRFDPLRGTGIAPYALAALTGHSVRSDVDDPGTQELLEGFYAGLAIGGGLAYSLGDNGGRAAVAEVRQVFASNIRHWAAEIGFRIVAGND